MRVLCINNKPIPGSGNKFLDLIVEGEIYTVIDFIDASMTWTGFSGYKLKEAKQGNFYTTTRFVPLTGDETETLEEMEVNQLINA